MSATWWKRSSLRPWGIEQRVRNAETEIDRLVQGAHLPKTVSRHILIGDPAERTIQHAREVGSDFLVTGPAHGKIIGDKLLGSTAARIVQLAAQPVLAVRRRAAGPYASVMVAVDFSEPSRQAYRCAREMFANSAFVLVHAYEASPDFKGRNADRPLDEVEAAEEAKVVRVAREDMADLVGTGQGEAATRTVLERGTPQAVIMAYAEKHWPDVVVTGTHGRSDVRQPLIGSVVEGLLRSLPCDVLAVPTRLGSGARPASSSSAAWCTARAMARSR